MDISPHSPDFLRQIHDAENKARAILDQLPPDLRYHVMAHTMDYVYPESQKLAEACGFREEGLLVMAVIALFHDTGFVEKYVANEPIGATHAKEYAQQSDSDTLRALDMVIHSAVMNTNMQKDPGNLFERIIRDADLSVIGKPEFLEWSNRLREEILLHPESAMYESATDDAKWAKSQLAFIQNHRWWTEIAGEMYQEQKEQNILDFKQKFGL